VNIYPVKGYSITVALDDAESQAAAPWVSLLDDRMKIVASRFGKDRFRIAGTAEFNGANKDIRADRIRPLVQWCEKHFPAISTEHATPWAGLRPMTPSMLPRVGRGRKVGVFYNTGHGHLGWTLSAATARLVAECVAKELRPRFAAARPVPWQPRRMLRRLRTLRNAAFGEADGAHCRRNARSIRRASPATSGVSGYPR
jgi:D-amino-acid dehydrogenase